jgi:release factor glutamine methyltransferase
VVQAALDLYRRLPETGTPPIIADIGTGSGCIAVALAIELPGAHLIASDASLAALTVARHNAARHGVDRRIAFRHTDVIPPENDIEMIVCNPPYIPLADRHTLPVEVREYEPHLALFGGADGLDFYRRLFEHPGDVTEDGWVIVEVGYDQAGRVKALANPGYWVFERSYSDVQGYERVLAFRAMSAAEPCDDTEGEDE